MLLGMGMVYGFLALLVVTINAMSKLIERFFPENPITTLPMANAPDDPGLIAAISIAVSQYRKKHFNL